MFPGSSLVWHPEYLLSLPSAVTLAVATAELQRVTGIVAIAEEMPLISFGQTARYLAIYIEINIRH